MAVKKKTVKKKAKKVVRKAKKAPQRVAKKAGPKEKLLGKVDHYFDKISVAAIRVLSPFKVGDVLHIKGHTTDFVQRLESMQIEHQDVQSVKKGDDIGIKVKDFVRGNDKVYLSSEKELTAKPVQPTKPQLLQQPMFPALQSPKPVSAPAVKPLPPKPQPQTKSDPYENKKFFSF